MPIPIITDLAPLSCLFIYLRKRLQLAGRSPPAIQRQENMALKSSPASQLGEPFYNLIVQTGKWVYQRQPRLPTWSLVHGKYSVIGLTLGLGTLLN